MDNLTNLKQKYNYEIVKKFDWYYRKERYSIIQNKDFFIAQFDTIEECEKYIEQIEKNREDEAKGKNKNNEYEVVSEWSNHVCDYRYYIRKKTGYKKTSYLTKEEAQKVIDTMLTSREEEISE
jgi:hypothetical protein